VRCFRTTGVCVAFMQASVLSPAAHDTTSLSFTPFHGVTRRCIPRHLNFVLDRARLPQHCPSPGRVSIPRKPARRACCRRNGLTASLNRSKLTSRGARLRLIANFLLPICGHCCGRQAPSWTPLRSDGKLTENLLSWGSSFCWRFVTVGLGCTGRGRFVN